MDRHKLVDQKKDRHKLMQLVNIQTQSTWTIP